jgi:hypothetical protein
MASTQFTRNYTDHSNSNGFQFEFHCDKCGNGFRSSYAPNKLGMASSFLGAAADMFGGVLGQAANAGNHLKDAMRGKAWDDAFKAAIDEIKPKFRQCRRDGKWVCPEICWNDKASLCKDCAPSLQEEAASAAAQGAADQLRQKASTVDLTEGVDLRNAGSGACPACNAAIDPGAKFCPSCGKPTAGDKKFCPKCGKPSPASAKFCPDCGAPKS